MKDMRKHALRVNPNAKKLSNKAAQKPVNDTRSLNSMVFSEGCIVRSVFAVKIGQNKREQRRRMHAQKACS